MSPTLQTLSLPRRPLWRERHDAPTFSAIEHRACVLVVEDDPVQALLLTLMLDHLGVAWTLVTHGAAAIDAVLHGRSYSMVLMDYRMPGVDGVAATRAIRRWEAENHRRPVPIAAVTACAMVDERRACVDAGMDDVLLKPFSAQSLADMLTRHGAQPQASLFVPGIVA